MLNNSRIAAQLKSACLLPMVVLLASVTSGLENAMAKDEARVKITPSVIVANGTIGDWHLKLRDQSFSAQAIYTIETGRSSNDIYITTYSLWPKKQAVTKKYSVLNVDASVFSPQFSPDGKKVLFKVGIPFYRSGQYKMYLWDIKANIVHEVRMPFTGSDLERPVDTFQNEGAEPFQYSFPVVKWSPNGKYLSYIRGGDIFGEVEYDNHIFLDAFDLKQNIRYFLNRNDAIPYGYEWTSDNNILYSAIEKSTINIYRISPDGKSRQLAIKNAYRPLPSPDGSKVIFFGPENFEEPVKLQNNMLDVVFAHGLSLSVANEDGSDRKVLSRERLYFPETIWMPDNKSVITVVPSDSSVPKNDRITNKVNTIYNITLWNVITGKQKHICDITATDVEHVNRINTQRQLTPLKVSRNGKLLFLAMSEMTGRNQEVYEQLLSLKVVDIQSGNIYSVGELHNVLDLQWRLDELH